MEEILEVNGDYRVKIVLDESPQEPEFDGQSPLLQFGYNYNRAEHVAVGNRPDDNDQHIENAAERWGVNDPRFDKYLRAYFGVTKIEKWWSGYCWYVTYDSAEWREYTRAPEGAISLSDYRAYVTGDVWYHVIQIWHTEDDFPDRETWEEIEFDPGYYYGSDYAVEGAKEVFAEFLEFLSNRNQ